MLNQPDDINEPQSDDGVPVGAADARADVERASGETGSDDDLGTFKDDYREDYLEEGAASGATDQGVPVGAADADEDRRRASGGSDS